MYGWVILLAASAASADLKAIEPDLARAWGPGAAARRLHTVCLFTLRADAKDEALGDAYFPNYGPSPSKATPHARWEEDIAKRGDKYFCRFQFFAADRKEASPGWKISRFYDGRSSWEFSPEGRRASKFEGVNPIAALNEDYYGDLIGFPGKPLLATRTVAGDLGEPYEVDKLIPTGQYSADEEAVGGEPCVVLDRPGLDRVWLAKDKGWAVVKREWHWSVKGPLKRRIVNRDLRQVAPGVWLPYAGEMEIYGHPQSRPGQKVGLLRAEVREIEVDIPDTWFEAERHVPRKTLVHEIATGARYQLGVSAQEHLDGTIAQAHRTPPVFRPEPWWRRGWWAWWAVAVAVVGGWVVWRRRSLA